MTEKNRIRVPIGTGDHLIELLMNRPKDLPRVTIECEPQSRQTRYLTVRMVHEGKRLEKYVHIENFEIFGTILKEMDREIEAME